MPYVKISDPSIIDLTAWHQVISVVNQHSDSIATLTNDFGISYTPDWTGDDYSVQYDMASQKIVYGRSKIVYSSTDDSNNNGTFWFESVDFQTAFSAAPVVTATVYLGTTSNPVTIINEDVTVSVYNVKSDGFKFRLYRPVKTYKHIDNPMYVNWIAVGPR